MKPVASRECRITMRGMTHTVLVCVHIPQHTAHDKYLTYSTLRHDSCLKSVHSIQKSNLASISYLLHGLSVHICAYRSSTPHPIMPNGSLHVCLKTGLVTIRMRRLQEKAVEFSLKFKKRRGYSQLGSKLLSLSHILFFSLR